MMGLVMLVFHWLPCGVAKAPLPVARPMIIRSLVFSAAMSPTLSRVFTLSSEVNRTTL